MISHSDHLLISSKVLGAEAIVELACKSMAAVWIGVVFSRCECSIFSFLTTCCVSVAILSKEIDAEKTVKNDMRGSDGKNARLVQPNLTKPVT